MTGKLSGIRTVAVVAALYVAFAVPDFVHRAGPSDEQLALPL